MTEEVYTYSKMMKVCSRLSVRELYFYHKVERGELDKVKKKPRKKNRSTSDFILMVLGGLSLGVHKFEARAKYENRMTVKKDSY